MVVSKRSNYFLLNTLEIPIFSDIYHLSHLTSLSTRLLYYLSSYQIRNYHSFSVQKRNGDTRIISSPKYSMRILQKWILVNILDKLQPSSNAMAYRKGKQFGCLQNASRHKYTMYTLSIDIVDFFMSIGAEKVYNLFTKIGYDKWAASFLTNICTLNKSLPQGGICSPALSNFINYRLDRRISGLCDKRGIVYTRYADDMFFSCDNKDMLKKTYPIICKIITNEGYSVNTEKTKYFTPTNRRKITGVVIISSTNSSSAKLKAPRELKMNLRAQIYNTITSGNYSEINGIRGKISYIDYIESNKIGDKGCNYKIRTLEYIQNCAKKIIHNEHLVLQYNSNLIYKGIPLLEYKPSDNSSNDIDFDLDDNSYPSDKQLIEY